ncbi:hypothetical protein LCGC14_2179760 [marine sediment metagenome]|uniref:HNH nuclease domain-containing protein n=1 Tax=marine sediment metagenome TaxID=412755 RepID=A0A0F9DMN0_9ZZZZ
MHAERNQEIGALLVAKPFLQVTEIANRFGLTHQRISQICFERGLIDSRRKLAHEFRVNNVLSRFLDKISPEPNSGCWLWNGAAIPLGYGRFAWEPCGGFAHRAAYLLFKGEIPSGKEIDHLCRVSCCVNPDHLEAVTHKVNIHRSPIHPAAINKRKTHCKYGHPLSGNNLGCNPTNGSRVCLNCARASGRRYYHRTYHPERKSVRVSR